MAEIIMGILLGIGIDIGCRLSMGVCGLFGRIKKKVPKPAFTHDRGGL